MLCEIIYLLSHPRELFCHITLISLESIPHPLHPSRAMPGKTAGLKVEVTEVQRRVSTGSVRRISDTSRSSVMSPTVLSAKVTQSLEDVHVHY